MASMTREERVQHYVERIVKASDKKAELERILSEINGLIYSESKKPLALADKLKIIEELEKLIKISPAFESLDSTRDYSYTKKSPSASDNSDILDVISAMKKRIK